MWLQRVGHDWETELNWDRWCNRNFFHCYWLILLTEAQNMSESWLNALGEKYNFAFWKKVVLWYNWCIINCSCVCVCVCVCVYCVLSRVWLFVTPWTVAHQASLSMGFLQTRILQWVAIPFTRGSSWARDQTHISCIGRRDFFFLLPLSHQESPI